MLSRFLSCALAVGFAAAATAQTFRSDEESFRVVRIAEGLEQPWCVSFLPDGRMLVTEKPGRLRVIADQKLVAAPVEGMPRVTVHGQGGFFDAIPHPQFEKNQLVYLSYAARGEGGAGTELARGRLIRRVMRDDGLGYLAVPRGRSDLAGLVRRVRLQSSRSSE